MRRAAAAVAGIALAGVLLGGMPGAGAASAASAASDSLPVVKARVRVQWVDGAGTHTEELDVLSGSGMMRFVDRGATVLVASHMGRFVQDPGGWRAVVPLAASIELPRPTMAHKFTVAAKPADMVAGRPVQVQDVYEGARLVERRAVDPDWRVLLRRVEYDKRGRPRRMIEVEQIDLASPAEAQALLRATKSAARAARPSARRVPRPLRPPAALAAQFQRVELGMEGATMHAVYSDGLHDVSVFGDTGSLYVKGLPTGQRVRVGTHTGSLYASAVGDVLVWQAGGTVYTAVGDAPVDELEAAAASMPGARPGSAGARVRRACQAVVAALTG